MNLHFIADKVSYHGKELVIATHDTSYKNYEHIIFLNDLSFGTMQTVVEYIRQCREDLCINIKHIKEIHAKLQIIHLVAKNFAVPNQRHIDFHFRDYFSNHSLIHDIMNQHKSGYIVKEIQNDTKTNGNAFSYKIRNIFRNHSYVDVKKYQYQSARGHIVEYIHNPTLPTLICIGDSLFHQLSSKKQYCQNQGNAMVVGIIKYFSYYSHKLFCNIIGILPIIESHQNETFSAIDTIVYALNTYTPKCILNFHLDLESNSPETVAQVYSLNDSYLHEISQLGEKNGEPIVGHPRYETNKEGFLRSVLLDHYKNKFIDIGIKENTTANGLISCIHFIKHIFRNTSERKKS